jgi:hypothetical protein
VSSEDLDRSLRQLRRQVALIRILRVGAIVLVMAAVFWAAALKPPLDKYAMFAVLAGTLLGWVCFIVHSIRVTREVQAGSVLLMTGQLDDAEVWLRRGMERFSLSAQAKLMAGQQLASLRFRRDAHQDVVVICRELLRHRVRQLRQAWVATRLMLADSLLMLDRVGEAYEAMRPVYDAPLSLGDRMRLLPIQLRYELAAEHSASAVGGLAEKVQIAELLESPRAALVHALLAEACRRQRMPGHHEFLAERARLYHDLDLLAERFSVIAPIAAEGGAHEDGETG